MLIEGVWVGEDIIEALFSTELHDDENGATHIVSVKAFSPWTAIPTADGFTDEELMQNVMAMHDPLHLNATCTVIMTVMDVRNIHWIAFRADKTTRTIHLHDSWNIQGIERVNHRNDVE